MNMKVLFCNDQNLFYINNLNTILYKFLILFGNDTNFLLQYK